MDFEDISTLIAQAGRNADVNTLIDRVDTYLGAYNRHGSWEDGLSECLRIQELVRAQEAAEWDTETLMKVLWNIEFFYRCCARTGAEAERGEVEFMWSFLETRREWSSLGVIGWIGAFYDDFFNGRAADPRQYNEAAFFEEKGKENQP